MRFEDFVEMAEAPLDELHWRSVHDTPCDKAADETSSEALAYL
jgi:hypothetical protein